MGGTFPWKTLEGSAPSAPESRERRHGVAADAAAVGVAGKDQKSLPAANPQGTRNAWRQSLTPVDTNDTPCRPDIAAWPLTSTERQVRGGRVRSR
jgi:hypothetical protein